MLTLVNTGSWLSQHSVRIAALGLPAIALCVIGLARSRRENIYPNARKNRPESAARSFAHLLESHGFDPAIALATYCYLDENTGGTLPIQPEDALEGDLGLNPDEIEHTLLALLALLGRKPALQWQRQSIQTVEDLIAVLQAAQPEVGQKAKAAA